MRLPVLLLAGLCAVACNGQPENSKSYTPSDLKDLLNRPGAECKSCKDRIAPGSKAQQADPNAGNAQSKKAISPEELKKLRKEAQERMFNEDFIMGNTSGDQAMSPGEPENAKEHPEVVIADEDVIEEEGQDDAPEARDNYNGKETHEGVSKGADDRRGKEDDAAEAAEGVPEESQPKVPGSDQADEPARGGANSDDAGRKPPEGQGKMQAYATIARELGGKYGNLLMINAKHYGAIFWQLTKHYGQVGWSSSKHYGKIAGKELRVYGAKGLETAKRFAKYSYKKGINGKDYLVERYREYRSRKANV